jgi:hypothetical protein
MTRPPRQAEPDRCAGVSHHMFDHRVAVLVVASFLAAFASSQTSRSTREGLALLHKLQDALGGAERIAAVRDFEETIRAQAWDASGASLGEVLKAYPLDGDAQLTPFGPDRATRDVHPLFRRRRNCWMGDPARSHEP